MDDPRPPKPSNRPTPRTQAAIEAELRRRLRTELVQAREEGGGQIDDAALAAIIGRAIAQALSWHLEAPEHTRNATLSSRTWRGAGGPRGGQPRGYDVPRDYDERGPRERPYPDRGFGDRDRPYQERGPRGFSGGPRGFPPRRGPRPYGPRRDEPPEDEPGGYEGDVGFEGDEGDEGGPRSPRGGFRPGPPRGFSGGPRGYPSGPRGFSGGPRGFGPRRPPPGGPRSGRGGGFKRRPR
jgi:hypothetical protein